VETQARHLPRGSTVVLITPSFYEEIAIICDYLLRRGLRPIAVLLDASSFGGLRGTDRLVENLKTLGIPVSRVANGDDLEVALSAGVLSRTKHYPIADYVE
jgi:hypothetical protein